MTRFWFVTLSCALGLLAVPRASAAPVALDPTFGAGGVAQTSTSAGEDLAHGLIALPNGGVVVSGYGSTRDQFVVAQFTAAGQADATFGTAGRRAITVGQFAPNGTPSGTLLRDPSGRLVVVGARTFGNCRLVVARLNGDGSIDNGFATAGVAEPAGYGGVVCTATSAALLPNGSVVAAGSDCCAYSGIVLARLLATGAADATFGTTGIAKPVNGQLTGRISIVLDAQGRITAAGTSAAGQPALRRFTAGGAPDPTFGSAGVASPAVTSGAFTALLQQPDASLVAAGHSGSQALLARFSSDGALDPAFGAGGVSLVPSGVTGPNVAIALQSDGKLIAAFEGMAAGSPGLWLARFDAMGGLDPGFGAQGLAFTPTAVAPTVRSIALQSDGRIVVLAAPNLLLRFEVVASAGVPPIGVPTWNGYAWLLITIAITAAGWRSRRAQAVEEAAMQRRYAPDALECPP